MTAIHEYGSTLLAAYAYDDLGRRTALARGNGTATYYAYDGASRLTALTHDLAGFAHALSAAINLHDEYGAFFRVPIAFFLPLQPGLLYGSKVRGR